MKYRKKPVVVEATQWFKNGDHPLDYSEIHNGFENDKIQPTQEPEDYHVRPFREADARAWVLTLALNLLAGIGMYATLMAALGYLWATYVPPKTCTPTLIDWALK